MCPTLCRPTILIHVSHPQLFSKGMAYSFAKPRPHHALRVSSLRAENMPPESVPVSVLPSTRDGNVIGFVWVRDNLDCREADDMLSVVIALEAGVSLAKRGFEPVCHEGERREHGVVNISFASAMTFLRKIILSGMERIVVETSEYVEDGLRKEKVGWQHH